MLKLLSLVAVAAALISAPACSAARDKHENNDAERHLDEKVVAVLDAVPEETVARFILTIEPDRDSKIGRERADAVISALQEAGAKAEWLEGSPVVFATCKKAAIYAALDTGYVATVQVDQLRKPMD